MIVNGVRVIPFLLLLILMVNTAGLFLLVYLIRGMGKQQARIIGVLLANGWHLIRKDRE